jgi:alkylated DNA repair dioxygenase AlkB
MDRRLTFDLIDKNRDALLADLNRRQAVLRDRVRGVAKKYSTGLYLFGRPGTAKTHTVCGVLDKEIPEPYVYQRGHLTPVGLFELLAQHPDSVVVLDDLAAIFRSDVALQILLSALASPSGKGHGRVVKYKRMGEEHQCWFTGGIVCISNLELHDRELLGAFKSRVHVLHYDPPDAELGALMLDIASRGWAPPGAVQAMTPGEGRSVTAHLIEELLRQGCRFDLRLLLDKAFPDYVQCQDGETESGWQHLVSATVREHLYEVQGGDLDPGPRQKRLEEDRAVVQEILRRHATREERIRAWEASTGRSERAFYRRLAELGDGSEKCQTVNLPEDAGTKSAPHAARDDGPHWLESGFSRQQLDDGSLFYHGRLPGEILWDDETFEEIWQLHPTVKPRILMHGKEVDIPRFHQAYGADYHFSGKTSCALPVPPVLVPLLEWAKRAIDPNLNGLLLNWYDGPDHYIGPHHDATKGLTDGVPIVTVSFGETRTFRLSQGSGEGRRIRNFPAPAGAVFVLPRETNTAWKHAVPKSARHQGRRVSVTLRAFAVALPDS